MNGKKNVGMLELNEISRTYFFPDNSEVTINGAVKCLISKNNTHQLMTRQREIYIIPHTWLAMKYIPIVKPKDKKSKK